MRQYLRGRPEHPKVDILVVQGRVQKHGKSVRNHPNRLRVIRFDVGGKYQLFIVPISDSQKVGVVRMDVRVPAADCVDVDEGEELDSVLRHGFRGDVSVDASIGQSDEMLMGISGFRRVPQDFRGHRELSVASKWAEEKSPEAVDLLGRNRHCKNPLFPPLEIDTPNVKIVRQGIRLEVTMLEPPRLIVLPRIHDQPISQLVRQIDEGILARASLIHLDIGDEALRGQSVQRQVVLADPHVRLQIVDVEGEGTEAPGGVEEADGAGVQHPKTVTGVHLHAVDVGEGDSAVPRFCGAPVGEGVEVWTRGRFVVEVDEI